MGASTDTTEPEATCTASFKTYMKKGQKNDKAEVIKLQGFLNTQLNLHLPLTGYFGPATENAVSKFQLANSAQILTPWVTAGKMVKEHATGYFFKTTRYFANKMICPSLTTPTPTL